VSRLSGSRDRVVSPGRTGPGRFPLEHPHQLERAPEPGKPPRPARQSFAVTTGLDSIASTERRITPCPNRARVASGTLLANSNRRKVRNQIPQRSSRAPNTRPGTTQSELTTSGEQLTTAALCKGEDPPDRTNAIRSDNGAVYLPHLSLRLTAHQRSTRTRGSPARGSYALAGESLGMIFLATPQVRRS
jgi:hypothetical protein